jgi:predicted transcriptional regulator
MRIARVAPAAIVFSVLGSTAFALPRPGERFPEFTSQDLVGQDRSTSEFVGHDTLLIAIADRSAGNAMRDWFIAAEEHVPANVARASLISIHVPIFVSTGHVRKEAREQVPERYWHATLLDRGNMAKELGLERGDTPFVFVLDEQGRVVVAVHATVSSPEAQEIWKELGRH